MSEMEWTVPVVHPLTGRTNLTVGVDDGEVVMRCPGGAEFVVPASSDIQLNEAVAQAREAQQQMGRWP